jgi:hypothetical protein
MYHSVVTKLWAYDGVRVKVAIDIDRQETTETFEIHDMNYKNGEIS